MSKLTAGMKRRIKREMTREKPTIWIGKDGSSQDLLGEIERQLEQKEIVKVKILKSALEGSKAAAVASLIADQTEANLVEVRGHTFVLYKRRKTFRPLSKKGLNKTIFGLV
ncbi:MAG: YhbY family RNA-binding protein [Candidatus Bathycorpusculaceae bacterium]